MKKEAGAWKNIWKHKSTAGITLHKSGWQKKKNNTKTASSHLPRSWQQGVDTTTYRGHLNGNILKHGQSKKNNPGDKTLRMGEVQGGATPSSSLQRRDLWWFNLQLRLLSKTYSGCYAYIKNTQEIALVCAERGGGVQASRLMGKQSRRKINQQKRHPITKTHWTLFFYGNWAEREGCSPFSLSCHHHLHSGARALPDFTLSSGVLPHRQ